MEYTVAQWEKSKGSYNVVGVTLILHAVLFLHLKAQQNKRLVLHKLKHKIDPINISAHRSTKETRAPTSIRPNKGLYFLSISRKSTLPCRWQLFSMFIK